MKIEKDNSNEQLFFKWKRLEHRYSSLLDSGASIVQNDYRPNLTVEDVMKWKKEMLEGLESAKENFNKLLTETLIFLLEE